MSLKNRNISRPSKAPTYRGNGRTYSMFASCVPARPLTDEEKLVEAHLHEKYDPILGEFQMIACKNMGKPLWFVRLYDCREIETNVGPHELDTEIARWLTRTYPEVATEHGITTNQEE